MSETKITPRQKFIVNLVNESKGLKRAEIEKNVAAIYPASKPTIARELSRLAKEGRIKIKGIGRSTIYLPSQDDPYSDVLISINVFC